MTVATHASFPFSLVRGGPFYGVLRAARLARQDNRDPLREALAFVTLTWARLVALALLEREITGGRWDPLLRDISVHTRLLVALPLMFVSEQMLHVFSGRCIAHFLRGEFSTEGPAGPRRIAADAERLRDAAAPELVIVAFAMLASQAVFWGLLPSTGLVRSGGSALGRSPAAIWYGFVALPIAQFVFGRWVWRWAIWTQALWRLSRITGRLEPLHPDRKGGIAFLADPIIGFAPGIMALSAVQAASWGTQMIIHGASPRAFSGAFTVMLVVALLLTHGPLLAWSPMLWSTRLRGSQDYSRFALDYTRLFHEKWIETGTTRGLLGTSDIQSLADLANGHTIVHGMLIIPFGRASVAAVLIAMIAPTAPLLLSEVPVGQLVRRLLSVTAGGAPL